jgi:hypothetical protein
MISLIQSGGKANVDKSEGKFRLFISDRISHSDKQSEICLLLMVLLCAWRGEV